MAEVALEIAAHDAGWYYADGDFPRISCPACGCVTDHAFASRVAQVKRGRDVVCTYDGHMLVSDRFRRFCLDNGYADVVFEPATAKGDYFDLRPTRILEVDIERTKPRLGSTCTRCGQIVSVHSGIGTIFRGVDAPLADGFYRSDMYWAHASEKHPNIIVAPETRLKIKAAGFRGIVYFAIMPPDIEALGRPRKAYR